MLSIEDARRLKDAGFLEYEIQELSKGKAPDGRDQPPIDLNSPVWQRALDARRGWVADKVNRGWSEIEIETEARRYYVAGAKRSPWDFLKAEYKPPLKTDYRAGLRARIQRQITESMGKYF